MKQCKDCENRENCKLNELKQQILKDMKATWFTSDEELIDFIFDKIKKGDADEKLRD